MNRWINRAAVLATLAATVSMVMAQGGGAGGGRGQGGPGGGMMGRGGGLLSRPEVKTELKITDAQGKKLEAALKPPAGQTGGGQRGPGGPGGGDQAAMQKRNAERDAKIKGVLSATQYKRYHELRLQQSRLSGLADPTVAAKIGVTKAQQDKIRGIQTKAMEAMRAQFQGGAAGTRPDMDKMRSSFEKARKDTDAKILATLTAAQKTKWTALLGKPFKFASR